MTHKNPDIPTFRMWLAMKLPMEWTMNDTWIAWDHNIGPFQNLPEDEMQKYLTSRNIRLKDPT